MVSIIVLISLYSEDNFFPVVIKTVYIAEIQENARAAHEDSHDEQFLQKGAFCTFAFVVKIFF